MGASDTMNKLFPGSGSFLVFILYMAMFVAQGMLVTASRNGGSDYTYNTVTVVLLTELLKLFLSSGVHIKNQGPGSLFTEVTRNKNVLLLYFVPASLYCLYNNLSFLSLTFFNPTSYFMFMQIRLLLTGVIYQILFKKRLSCKQWGSLSILTLGCMVHAAGTASSISTDSSSSSMSVMGMGFLFILTQVLCSVFAGVYNEYLIKGKGADIDIMIQNVFMYLDSILCNLLILGGKGDLATAFTSESLSSINNPLVIALIVNNAFLGIITSLFLQKLNSILKAFASALELVFTAMLSWPILGIPLNLHTVIAVMTISVAVIIYAKNPVVVSTPLKQSTNDEKV